MEPYKIYDQVKCEFCGENFNSKNSAGKVLVLTDHKCVEIILVSFGLVEQQWCIFMLNMWICVLSASLIGKLRFN